MDIVTILVLIILGMILVLSLLMYGIRNLLIQNEALEESLEISENNYIDLVNSSRKAYDIMNQADIKGSFASDDEVGSAFKTMKDALKEHMDENNLWQNKEERNPKFTLEKKRKLQL